MFNEIDKEKRLSLILVLVTFFLLIITVYITNLFFSDNTAVLNVDIKGLSSTLPKISDEEKNLLTYQLFNNVSLNTPLSSKINNDFYVATDSVNENIYDTYSLKTFIIKSDSSNQEYKVEYYDGSGYDDYKINIYCVSNCLATDSQSNLIDNLPYSETTADIHWTLKKNEYFSPNNTNLIVDIDSCKTNPDTTEIENSIKSFLANYNINEYRLSKKFSCYTQD
ncbi:hypothetical protein IKG45_03940 [Candidatus Saccharibacteria bacterium]|nr:hypothetical protein [Candidatus Saccharibacteria bacterium]